MEPTSPFLKLPGEIRNSIYSLLLSPRHVGLKRRACRQAHVNHGFAKRQEKWYDFQVSILRVNRQINNEASAIWRRENIFVIVGFQADIVPRALVPSITLSPNFQMYQQVAATMTLNSTYAGALNGSLVKRLYALQDLETAIPQDLLAYQCW